MEETDSTSWPGGVDPVPEVQSPPTWPAQLHSPTTACLLCPYWNCGSVSPWQSFEGFPRLLLKYVSLQFCFPSAQLCVATFRKWGCVLCGRVGWREAEVWQERRRKRNETTRRIRGRFCLHTFDSLTDRRACWFPMWCDAAWRRWRGGGWTRWESTEFQELPVRSARSKLHSTTVRKLSHLCK